MKDQQEPKTEKKLNRGQKRGKPLLGAPARLLTSIERREARLNKGFWVEHTEQGVRLFRSVRHNKNIIYSESQLRRSLERLEEYWNEPRRWRI